MRLPAGILVGLLFATPAAAGELVVTVSDTAGKPAADAVVMVWPSAGPKAGARLAGPFVMAQQDTQFRPYVLIVPVGAEVSFPNLDPFRHHVFSFSKAKTFELKLYGQDETRRVRFDRAGVVGVGCNIHDAMSGFIRVVDTPYAVKTGPNGVAVLRDVPGGPATVSVWHPYQKGAEASRAITTPETGTARLSLTADLRGARLRRRGY